MNYFLAKIDPSAYSIEDLKREKQTTWEGVRNPQAVKAIKSMVKGDRVLIYHSQGESAIRGLAEVVGNSRPDLQDEKSWLIDVRFLWEFSEPYITLSDVKQEEQFASLPLVKQSRLSTMPLTKEFVKWLASKGLKL